MERFNDVWELGQDALSKSEEIFVGITIFIAESQLKAKTLADHSILQQSYARAEKIMIKMQNVEFLDDPQTYELRILSRKAKLENLVNALVEAVDQFEE